MHLLSKSLLWSALVLSLYFAPFEKFVYVCFCSAVIFTLSMMKSMTCWHCFEWVNSTLRDRSSLWRLNRTQLRGDRNASASTNGSLKLEADDQLEAGKLTHCPPLLLSLLEVMKPGWRIWGQTSCFIGRCVIIQCLWLVIVTGVDVMYALTRSTLQISRKIGI